MRLANQLKSNLCALTGASTVSVSKESGGVSVLAFRGPTLVFQSWSAGTEVQALRDALDDARAKAAKKAPVQ